MLMLHNQSIVQIKYLYPVVYYRADIQLFENYTRAYFVPRIKLQKTDEQLLIVLNGIFRLPLLMSCQFDSRQFKNLRDTVKLFAF